jgi:hypothetical protein
MHEIKQWTSDILRMTIDSVLLHSSPEYLVPFPPRWAHSALGNHRVGPQSPRNLLTRQYIHTAVTYRTANWVTG